MKIGLVTPYYYPTLGGVQEHIFNYYKILKNKGYYVKIIAPSYPKISSKIKLFFSFEKDVIRIGKAFPLRIYGTEDWIALPFGLDKKVKNVLDIHKFDILHFHSPLNPFLNFVVLKNSKSINIGTFHAYAEKNIFCSIFRKTLEKYLKRLDGIICVSCAAKEFLTKYFDVKVEIIPNGIDLDRFKTGLEKIKRFDDGKINILFVGRNTERKGAKYLLKAFEIIKEKIKNVRLIMVGKGFDNYEGKDIFFEGAITPENLPYYYATADIYCSPAIYGESFGIILLEAMACSVPVVASDIKGYNEVITNKENGLLIPPMDVEKLAYTIIEVIQNKELKNKLKRNGLKKVQDYSWDKITDRILEYYDNFLGK